jgi:hypothetical protein
MLTGLKDTDREILKYIDDKELLRVCSIDKRTWTEVCDDNFLRRRLNKYPEIEQYKPSNQSWKQFFLDVVNYVSLLQNIYRFKYTEGNFYTQYFLFKKYDINHLLVPATKQKELAIVKHAIETSDIFCNISQLVSLPHATYFRAIWIAKEQENTEIRQYLAKCVREVENL